MERTGTELADQATVRGVISRWWPVGAALIVTELLPYVGIVTSFAFAFIRRRDRSVMVTLIVIGVLGLLLLSLFFGAGGGESGSGG